MMCSPALRNALAVLLLAAGLPGCGPSHSSSDGNDAGPRTADNSNRRGSRYCEVLLGTIGASNVQIDVYSTEGLSDCPDAQWSTLNVGAVQASTNADTVVLNGPRYWMLNSLAGSVLLDTAVVTIAGMQMRRAGALDVPLASVATLQRPYTDKTIQRDARFHWWSGQSVYELVDANGRVFTMQSYSVQNDATLTEASLASLGSRLASLPAGWAFRTRVLTADLDVSAVNRVATVTTDELGNTYSLSE